jgi:putative cardiolipin synthase
MTSPQRICLSIVVALLAGCAELPPRPALPDDTALAAGRSTRLDQGFDALEVAHPGQSGFRLLFEGTEAFAVRVRSAALADRSLDVQSYIWHGDESGVYIVKRLLDAADRGVKVRLLLDDMDARAKNAGFAALDAHANIAVRMFNPFGSRSGTLAFLGEGLTSFRRINHRMHNKTWIADNRLAIAGGRNIGDEYFGASEEVNFVDLDFAMVGPIVRDASASFDRYWNSPAAYPMDVLDPKGVDAAALEKLRAWLAEQTKDAGNSRYAQALQMDEAVQRLVRGEWSVEWTGESRFVSDDPLKATLKEHDLARSQVLSALGPIVGSAQHDLDIVSPYFVPGEQLTERLVGMAGAGTHVRVLTNSLIANDVAAVHGGYSRHRDDLLAGGVQIWELKPLSGGQTSSSLFGSSGASLHTKAILVDGETAFVGSYNLDPRSTWLNCEQGVIVENAAIGRQLATFIERQQSGEHAWRVTVEDGTLSWTDGDETFDREPNATAGRRFQAWFARVLHLDSQL